MINGINIVFIIPISCLGHHCGGRAMAIFQVGAMDAFKSVVKVIFYGGLILICVVFNLVRLVLRGRKLLMRPI